MIEVTIGLGAKKKFQQVSFSNDTIRRRIDDMAANVCQQVCFEIKETTLQASIQLDHSTNSALESHLIVFRKMKEEFFFTNTLSAADVKALVDSFIEANELCWQNFKHIYTDSIPAIIGIKSGFVTLVKNEWPHVTSLHCLLHRYTPASKTLPLHFMEVMDGAVKVISFIYLIKSPVLPTFGLRNGSATCRTFVLYQRPLGVEKQMPLSVV